MDKETLSNYGWIVICVLVMAVMIALATPFGNFIKDAVWSTTQGLFGVQDKALNIVMNPGKSDSERVVSVSGNPLIIKDSIAGVANELNATLQNENGFNSITVSVTGKNLFNKTNFINGTVSQPTLTTMYPISTYGEHRIVYIPIADGATYTISQTVFGKYARYGLTDTIIKDKYSNDIAVYHLPMQESTDDVLSYAILSETENSRTFVNKFNHKFLVAWIYDGSDTLSYDEIADSIQVEPGSVASSYEAYKEKLYTISLGETVNSGTIDIINGIFTKPDKSTVSTEKYGVTFYEGYNVVSVTNATNISANYTAHTNPLAGKRIIAIGDSMVQGHTLADDKTWLSLIAERNNMTYVNYGRNGSYMTHNPREANLQTGVYDSVYDKYTTMHDDADYVIVFSGTNDIDNKFPIGDSQSKNPSEFFGALNAIAEGLQKKYPTAKIIFITPYARAGYENITKQYVNAISTVCKNKGFYIYDNTTNSVIDWTNSEDINNYTLGDGYHLNESGMELASYKYEEFLKQIS